MTNCIRSLVCILCIFSLTATAQHTDPGMHDEHEAVMNLVPVSAATHTAVTSGNWTNPATWNTNAVPGAGAKVVIPQGQTVTYNGNSTASLAWIRVDGKLQFTTTQNTVLYVETIVVAPSGEYQQGTVSSPIPANVTSVITFVDNGALTDPLRVARGLLSHGKVRICGAVLTPFLKTTTGLTAGATQAMLTSAPANWKVGDQVAITALKVEGGNPYYSQDEIKTIAAINSSTITFSNGLTYARKVEYPQWGLYPYMANTTRNIQYRSANTTDHTRKGHVMFMHNPDVDVRWAGFYDLGRTDKNKPVSDKVGQPNSPGDNPRGKYSLHFHRTGHQKAGIAPAYVVGCAVVNSPGWGYVNHDSYVIFEDNVSYNVTGAHFVCENGAERGAFRRNMAMKTVRPTPYRGVKDGTDNHDLAHSGHGFWLQGGNVIVEDNVASGCMEAGFTWFTRSGGGHNSNPNQFTATALLLDPEGASGRSGLSAADLPIMSNKNNTAYGCVEAMHSVDVEINGTGPTNSMIENLVSLNSKGVAILVEYYRNFTFKNCKILRDPGLPSWEMAGSRAIQAHNLIDHMYPLETRSADRAINLIVRNYEVAIKNFNGAGNDDRGEAVDMAKWQVIGPPIDHNCPNGAFNNTGSHNGIPLVTTVAKEEDLLPFPAFSPAAGTYNTAQTVTISSVPGAIIYYVIGSHNERWQSLEYKLKTGSWTRYTGPVTVNQNRRLIAVAVKDGQYSRVREGYYYLDATQPPPATQVAAPVNEQSLSVYPNPVNGNMLTVQVYSDRNVDAQISILSSTLDKLSGLKQTLVKGNNTIQVPVGHLSNGIHMVVVQKGTERMVKQVVIRK
jgi:hypothetical protein